MWKYRKGDKVVIDNGISYRLGTIVSAAPDSFNYYLVWDENNAFEIMVAGGSLWPYNPTVNYESCRCPKCAHFDLHAKPGTLYTVATCDYCGEDTHAIRFRAFGD